LFFDAFACLAVVETIVFNEPSHAEVIGDLHPVGTFGKVADRDLDGLFF
jgi:hypothetical protein